jgi:hypothetical protein
VSIEVEEPSLHVTMTITATEFQGRFSLIAVARSGQKRERVTIGTDRWNAKSLFSKFGKVSPSRWLSLEVLGESPAGILVRVESSIPVEHFPRVDAVWWNEDLDAVAIRIVRAVSHEPVTTETLATQLGLDASRVRESVERLIQQRGLRRDEDGKLHAIFGNRHRTKSALVGSLFTSLTGEPDQSQSKTSIANRTWARVASRGAVISIAVAMALLLTVTDTSFVTAVALLSMAATVFIDGAFPQLIGFSLRRRAEHHISTRFANVSPTLSFLLIGLLCIVCLAYSIIIYRSFIERSVAAIAFLCCSSATIASWKFGSFKRRTTISIGINKEGIIKVEALSGETRLVSVGDEYINPSISLLTFDIDGPIYSPVLLIVHDGDVVPATVGGWSIYSVDENNFERLISSGLIADVSGDEVVLSSTTLSKIRIRLELR